MLLAPLVLIIAVNLALKLGFGFVIGLWGTTDVSGTKDSILRGAS